MPHHFGTMKLEGRGAGPKVDWINVAPTETFAQKYGPVGGDVSDARPNYWKQTRPTPMPTGLPTGFGLIPVEQVIRGPSIKRGEGLTSDAIKRLESLRPKPIQRPNIKFNL
jgi:hypothetical protein